MSENERFPSPFQSFFMGGFECATHRRRDGLRIDVMAATGHDLRCASDYRLLAATGMFTVRDGLRWHLIETVPGVYDWSSFLPMLRGAHAAGTQVIWDLCHWGVPVGLDIFSEEFVERFGAFATAAAQLIKAEREIASVPGAPLFCAVNEISFWAWVGGDVEHFYPFGHARGAELKTQLVRASIAAIRAVKAVLPDALFVQPEPIINISADPDRPEDEEGAALHAAGQFEAWDMLCGLTEPELGGAADLLNVIGVNYYWNNQWIQGGDRTPPGHHMHRPLHVMLQELWERYGNPIILAETGTELGAEYGWIGYIMGEVRQARRLGVPVIGVCLYPVMDYMGWDNDRHCGCGLIAIDDAWGERSLRHDLCAEVKLQQLLLDQA